MLTHFWASEVLYLTVVALFLPWALLRITPAERGVYVNTLWLFLAGVLGQGVAVLLTRFDMPQMAAPVHSVFRIVSAVAFIRIGGFAVFRLLLPFLGRSSPRIVEDLAIVVVYVIYGFTRLRAAGVGHRESARVNEVIDLVFRAQEVYMRRPSVDLGSWTAA